MPIRPTNIPKAYGLQNALQDLSPYPIINTRDPISAPDTRPDVGELGQFWINTSSNTVFCYTSDNTWTSDVLPSGTALSYTASGDGSGYAFHATGGNIVADAGNLSISGTSTLTGNTSIGGDLSIAGSISLSGAVTITPTNFSVTTSGNTAGVITLDAEGGTSSTVVLKNGTGTAANSVQLTSTAGGLTLTGGLGTADAINLVATTAGGGIDIDSSTGGISLAAADGVVEITSGTGAINIGADAAAHTITIGNVTGATAVAVNTGTGSFTVATTGSGDIILNSDDTMLLDADGVLELNSSAGAISIGNDADAQNINIGTGAAARTITIGNITGATAITHNSGSGANLWTTTNASWGLSTGTGAINVGTDAAAKTITIGNVTAATAVNVNTGTGGSAITTTNGVIGLISGTGAINIGADAAAKTITVGNVTGATAVAINTGTGGHTVTTTGTGDIVLNSADTVLIDSAGVLELNSSAGVIGIGNDAVAQNINIGTGAAARTITIGNVTGATAVAVNTGTGSFTVTTTGTGDIVLNSDDTMLLDSDGVLELNSSAGIIGIGNDADAFGINVGTGAAARPIVIGNTTAGTTVKAATPTGIGLGIDCGSTTGLRVITGAIAELAALTAPKGSLFLATDGSSTSTRLYINSDSGTGWVAITTAS